MCIVGADAVNTQFTALYIWLILAGVDLMAVGHVLLLAIVGCGSFSHHSKPFYKTFLWINRSLILPTMLFLLLREM